MKQLLIVKTGTTLNQGATATDLSSLADGAIAFTKLLPTPALITSAITGNFNIALGKGTVGKTYKQLPFMIPEVDFNSLTVVKTTPSDGAAMVKTVTVSATTKEVGFVIVKRGTVPHEHNTNSFTIQGTGTAATDAATLKTYFETRNNQMNLPFTATISGAVITLTCTEKGTDYDVIKFGDVTIAQTTAGAPVIGDKKYIADLASKCAAGKGFNDTDYSGREFLPNYPEAVESDKYWIYTLRFAVKRDSAKTRDEVVNQIVHIAIPNKDTTSGGTTTSAPEVSLDTLFGSKIIAQ